MLNYESFYLELFIEKLKLQDTKKELISLYDDTLINVISTMNILKRQNDLFKVKSNNKEILNEAENNRLNTNIMAIDVLSLIKYQLLCINKFIIGGKIKKVTINNYNFLPNFIKKEKNWKAIYYEYLPYKISINTFSKKYILLKKDFKCFTTEIVKQNKVIKYEWNYDLIELAYLFHFLEKIKAIKNKQYSIVSKLFVDKSGNEIKSETLKNLISNDNSKVLRLEKLVRIINKFNTNKDINENIKG
jgi:hypothetical protein